MLKIADSVKEVLYADEEALASISNGYMNLAKYAERIRPTIEDMTMKEVSNASIVVALSRLSKEIGATNPIVQNVKINNIITKSPLTEIVYRKTTEAVSSITNIYNSLDTDGSDFLTMTFSTNEITIICSDRLKPTIKEQIEAEPVMETKDLAAIGIAINPDYYPKPNITFSLLRRIALKRIPLAETITTRTEIMFIFDQKYLSDLVSLFVARDN